MIKTTIIDYDSETFKHYFDAIWDNTKVDNWIKSSILWVIDNSKFKQQKRLDAFLRDQISNPHPLLVAQAQALAVYAPNGKFLPNDTVTNIIRWVLKTLKYQDDLKTYGTTEKWANAVDILNGKLDDCDGFNSLIMVLCRLAGIPSTKIFNVIGPTSTEGHYWCVYHCSYRDQSKRVIDKLVVLDGTYFPTTLKVEERPEYNKLTYYGKPWYIFNDEVCIKPL